MICYGKDNKTNKGKEMIKYNNRRGLKFWVVIGQFQRTAQRAEKRTENFNIFCTLNFVEPISWFL